MKLSPGQKYEVTDWYGMIVFEAEYVGPIRNFRGPERLHLLRRVKESPGGYVFAGCEIRIDVDRDGNVKPFFYATHYGDSLEELSHCTGRDRVPKWGIVKP